MKRSRFLAICALAIAALAADWQAEGERWWKHVRILADDSFEGRDTGSEGHRKAAEYVVQEFERARLKPAGTDSYFQPVRFDVRRIEEEHSWVEFGNQRLKLGEDVILNARGAAAGDVDAEAVFVRYGLSIPEARYDDLAGLDLRGKIAVYYAGGPKRIPGNLRAHYSSAAERRKALARAGAIGSAMIQRPDYDVPWPRAALRRLQPSMSLEGEEPGPRISMTINPAHADRFLAGSGHSFAEILAADRDGQPLPRFPLANRIRAKIAVAQSVAESQNIIGLAPGADPKLRNEYVVLTAHLDGLGVGAPINGDRIYNGAMDDAAGVATLLEIARGLRASGEAPRRSLLFAVLTAEEKGLLGSRFFAGNPTVARDRIVANINVDMFLPLTPLKSLEAQGVNESTLGDHMRDIGREAGIEVLEDREPERNLFIRSDQYNFILKGVPALAFKFGYAKGSPEEKVYKDWLRERYHAPSDDAAQPVDRAAAARFNDLIARLAVRIANAPERPRWKETSFFRRFVRE